MSISYDMKNTPFPHAIFHMWYSIWFSIYDFSVRGLIVRQSLSALCRPGAGCPWSAGNVAESKESEAKLCKLLNR